MTFMGTHRTVQIAYSTRLNHRECSSLVFVDDQTTIHSAVPTDTNDIEFDSPAVQMQALLQTFA